MKIYLVGGAVRDKLLGLPVKERDWVVVGATPQKMLDLGFKKVGKDFPVFLHPKTHEEYALARTERKTGKGYTNFICYSDPSVTLEDDLKRRDLTINAMAQDADNKDGYIIDPYDGQKDLKNKIFRHVSEAFAEDPVRILRIARFAARLGDFKVCNQTNNLMQKMLENGEVDALVPERVWQELNKALGETYSENFFLVLKNCLILEKLFPQINTHYSAIINTLIKANKIISKQIQIIKFASITFNFTTEADIKILCEKYRIPGDYKTLSLLAYRFKNYFKNIYQNISLKKPKKEDYINILEKIDAYRRPDRLEQFLLILLITGEISESIYADISKSYQLTKDIKLTPEDIAQNDKNILRQILHIKRLL